MWRSKQHHVRVSSRYQRHAPQDESAHEQFAQFRVGLYDFAQLLRFDGYDNASLANPDAHEGNAAAQRTHFSAEVPRAQHVQQVFAGRCPKENFETAGQDDENIPGAFAGLDQNLACASFDTAATRLEPRQLRLRELGKYLLP